VSYEKLVVVFAMDIDYVEGERANQKEVVVVVEEAVKIYFTCGSRDFLLLLSLGLPAGSQVPTTRTH
jgi:hypothetical protein